MRSQNQGVVSGLKGAIARDKKEHDVGNTQMGE